jgi:membrane protease YdiL (CAAX protease family)
MTSVRQQPRNAEPKTAVVRRRRIWTIVAIGEAVAAGAVVIADLLIPSLVLLAMAVVSLRLRRAGLGSLGLRRIERPAVLALKMLALASAWSLVQLSITMPIANHVSGHKQDLSGFADLEGNVGVLGVMLALGWTLGAFVEELAYRGYLLTRLVQAGGGGRTAVVIGVLLSSMLFGVAHSEQGAIGVLVVSLDAVVFSVVRLRYRTVWASVLVHGFNNTLGFLTFFVVGPVYGLW